MEKLKERLYKLLDNQNLVALWFLRFFVFLGVIYAYKYNQKVNDLVLTSSPNDYITVKKHCKRSRGGSSIYISTPQGERKIEYYGDKCFNLKIGQKVKLYYFKELDVYHIPGSHIYERYLHGLIGLLVILFIPWSKIGDSFLKFLEKIVP